MKKLFSFVSVFLILLLLTACVNEQTEQDNSADKNTSINSSNDTNELSVEPQGPNNLAFGDGSLVYSGVYTVGDHIETGSYILTCTETSYLLKAIVFEDISAYNSYYSTKRNTNGEEWTAIEQNALVDFYAEKGDARFLGLNNGNVIMIDGGEGRLEKINLEKIDEERGNLWFDENNAPICAGVYFVGRDMAEGQYKLTCASTGWSMAVTIYESSENYFNYHKSSRSTNGEESDAIQQYSLSNTYVYDGESCFIDLKEGYVLMIKDGTGSLEMIYSTDDSVNLSASVQITLPMYPGVYYVGEHLEPNAYIVTCTETDWLQQIVVFESKEDYINYHRTSRTTNGEELAAIEQNAMSDFYIEQGESCYLNLQKDMVLLVENGAGVADAVNTEWAVK